jgi:hypothetical protein
MKATAVLFSAQLPQIAVHVDFILGVQTAQSSSDSSADPGLDWTGGHDGATIP